MAPFVSLIHSVNSLKLLQEINKQAQKTVKLWVFKYTLPKRKLNLDVMSKNLLTPILKRIQEVTSEIVG
jgi:uncharacterized pyridoxal phosphate-containing UPF0001 family protein